MKKKVLFTAFNMRVGGVEKTLVNLVNNMDYDKYDITVLLQVKDGELLSQIDPHVNVKGYEFKKYKNKILKKIANVFVFLKVIISNYHKYDFAGCYASGYMPSAIVARFASKNNAAWMHTNILRYMEMSDIMDPKHKGISTEKKAIKFLNRMFFRKFKRNIFVSYNGRDAFLKLYPNEKEKTMVCHNLIDYNSIYKSSEEKINVSKTKPVFLNVGRHTEYDKKLSRILNACVKLKKDFDFELWLVGDGIETKNYKKFVRENNLEDIVLFTGLQSNPFPYYNYADAFVLCSNFEGFPTVFLESMMMNVPIITTDVSDSRKDIEDKYVPENSLLREFIGR